MRRLMLWLYPRRWRRRYGDEFGALLKEIRVTPRVVLDVLRGAAGARWRQSWRPVASGLVALPFLVLAAGLAEFCLLMGGQLVAATLGHPMEFRFAIGTLDFFATGQPFSITLGPGAFLLALVAGVAGSLFETARVARAGGRP
jgi:hypothetical protein